MGKPTSKTELLNLANSQFKLLLNLIDSFSESDKLIDFIFDASNEKEEHYRRDKNIRDVLIHLYEWHNLLINWVNSNKNSIKADFLPKPYTWKTYGEMNVELFWKKHQTTPYDEARRLLIDSHNQVISLISQFNDLELFTKSYFNWTGTTSLGQYCISASSSHYDWAIKKLKKQAKALQLRS